MKAMSGTALGESQQSATGSEDLFAEYEVEVSSHHEELERWKDNGQGYSEIEELSITFEGKSEAANISAETKIEEWPATKKTKPRLG
jgi:hypothetical protein